MAPALKVLDDRQKGVSALPRGTLATAGLAVLLGAALLGVFGGGPSPSFRVRASEGTLTVVGPDILRSGLFFEHLVRVDARQPVGDLVIAIDGSLVRDMTVNTIEPAPSDEEFKDGGFRFHYGPLEAGERFEMKLDGQVNPPLTGGNAGTVAWYDGERRIAALPLRIRVYP